MKASQRPSGLRSFTNSSERYTGQMRPSSRTAPPAVERRTVVHLFDPTQRLKGSEELLQKRGW
jgi:hypothetical protein